MDFWPADFRTDVAASTKKGRKGKEGHGMNDQSLEPGTLGAATLISGRKSFQWTTLVQPPSGNLPHVVGKPLEVFPSTKRPLVNVPRLSVHQRAEQGARFLRTYHPDVDVPFELIKEKLQSDNVYATDSAWDPYAGNRLAHLSLESRRKKCTHFLAFACGETGADLNVSPFRVTRDKIALFSPSALPAFSFDTPIHQIVSFSPSSDLSSSDLTQSSSLFAVRTHAALSVLELQAKAVPAEGGPIVASVVTPIFLSDTGHRRVVDMSCNLVSSAAAQILLVNDIGAVYNSQVQENKIITIASNARESEDTHVDHFWRIVRRDASTCIRSSHNRVHLFDSRARTAPESELFHLSQAREYMTSIESASEGRHTMCFSTTSKLVWFDERNLRSPVISLLHQRAFDRTLHVRTVPWGPAALATLSSAANPLVTVYDVNYASSGHIHLYGEPSILSGSPRMDLPIAGTVFFRHSIMEGPEFSLFQLSSRGSVWKTNVGFSDETTEGQTEHSTQEQGFEWTEDVNVLAEKAKTMSEDIETLGVREYLEANLHGLYDKMFQLQHDVGGTHKENAEAVYQTLERMPYFCQDMNEPVETMLLTFDVAFQCGLEPHHSSRADFLTECSLSSPQGCAALTMGRIPIPRMLSTVRWHHDLSLMPPQMVPDLSTSSPTLIARLREESLAHAATAEGMRRVNQATQYLALDLALSRHVYAPQSFSKTDIDVSGQVDDPTLLSRATEAMSLSAAEPPPVRFGFLRPVAKIAYEDGERMVGGDESNDVGLDVPIGVRLLISQWKAGENPEEYSYKDPYEEQNDPPPSRNPVRRETRARGQLPEQPKPQAFAPVGHILRRPPLVVSTSQLPAGQPPTRTASMLETRGLPALPASSPARHLPSLFPRRKDVTTNSQGEFRPDQFPNSSQDLGPSTQPLPGPFGGGRPSKKNVKKRMGGF